MALRRVHHSRLLFPQRMQGQQKIRHLLAAQDRRECHRDHRRQREDGKRLRRHVPGHHSCQTQQQGIFTRLR